MKSKIQYNYTLSLQDTLLIKGVAICFMLWHHLFFDTSAYGDFVQNTAFLGKVCVAMFLFVSAYGLTIQFADKKNYKYQFPSFTETIKFQAKRLFKLYVNYWFVFLIFVPVGILFFNRTLQIAYGIQINKLNCLFFDFFGMQGFQSYNITWWFYQLIIILYLIFPILYFAVKKMNIFILGFFFLILGFHQIRIPIVHDWLFPFALGISCALNKEKISMFLNRINRKILFISTLILLLSIAFLRLLEWRFGGIGMDGFFTLTWVLFIIISVREVRIVTQVLKYLGKHSMNIFMIHTFIFSYFYSGFIYSFKYPILIFSALLTYSILISILIEYSKTRLGIYRFEKKWRN